MWQEQKSREEISHGFATAAEVASNLTTAWNSTAKQADVNDPSFGERFREEQLEPILQDWASGFSTEKGRAWAESQIGSLRQHFFEKTAADQAAKSGFAAVKNIDDFTTQASNAAMADPTSVNMWLGMSKTMGEAVIASLPNLTPQQAEQVKGEILDKTRKDILRGGFIGMAKANPDAAIADLEKGYGAQDLDAGERDQLRKYAEGQKNAKEQDTRAAAAAEKAAAKQDFDSKMAQLNAALYNPDGSISVKPGMFEALQDMANHPGVDAGAISSARGAMAQATKDTIGGAYRYTDNKAWGDLASRIGRDVTDPLALTHAAVDQAYASGKLSASDYRFLSGAVPAAGTQTDKAASLARTNINASIGRMKGLITKSNMYSGVDKSGDALYDTFNYDAWQRYNGLVASGMSPAEAEKQLLDPRNPQGLQAMVPLYQTNNKQGLANLRARTSAGGVTAIPTAPALGGKVTPRLPGESVADYLKRRDSGDKPAAPAQPAAPVKKGGIL